MLTVYKASAGSGKTFTLTKLFLKFVLGIKDPATGRYRLNHSDFGTAIANRHRHILAITFTNKATEEMKSRIISYLDTLAHDTASSPYAKEFIDLFGCTEQQLGEASRKAMTDLLHDYRNFNVSTIDSFFQQVLRSMAYELDYPGDYEVVLEGNGVIGEAVGMMLDEFNYSPSADMHGPVARALRGFMLRERAAGRSFNLFNRGVSVHRNLIKRAAVLFNERYQLVARDFEKWLSDPEALPRMQRRLDTWKQEILEANRRLAQRYIDTVTDAGFKWPADLQGPGKTPVTDFFAAGEPIPVARYGNKYVTQTVQGHTPETLFLKKPRERATQQICDMLTAQLRRMLRLNARYLAVEALEEEMQTYSFMAIINANVERFRRDNNIIVLADTNRLLQRVMDDGNVPFVYEKMGVALRHFLIDEFQDTSRMQWDNLLPLLENGLSESHDSLIIGDEKQSIYRFRNSDSNLLRTEVSRHFDGEVEIHGDTPAENTNWRSAATIVRFNNTFFASLARLTGSSSFGNVMQGVAESNMQVPGYVRFLNTTGEPEEPEVGENLQMQRMLGEIMRQHDAGYRWNDIAILTVRIDEATEAARFLLDHGVPVTTDEALLVGAAPSVAMVVSAMEMSLHSACRAPAEGQKIITDARIVPARFEYFYNLNIAGGADTDTAVRDAMRRAIDEGPQALNPALATADITEGRPSTLTSMVETIIERRIHPADRLRDLPYLAAFHDAVMQYTSTYGDNPVGFLRWWKTTGTRLSVASPADADAVRIMTIHKSKGLQFPCVHIPYGSSPLAGNPRLKDSTWMRVPPLPGLADLPPAVRITFNAVTALPYSPFASASAQNSMDRMNDGLNRTYVAYTRAVRELCVYYDPEKDFGKQIVEACQSCGTPTEPLTCDLTAVVGSDGEITVGEPTKPLAVKETPTEENPGIPIDNYTVQLSGPGSHITSVEMLVSPTDTGVDDDENAEAARAEEYGGDPVAAERGKLMHYVLSTLRDTDHLDRTLRRAMRRGLSADDAETLRRAFADESLAPEIGRWFAPGVRAISEMPILIPEEGPHPQAVRRPDRVVWHDDGVIEVVDFKFTSHTAQRYHRQVLTYMHLLSRIFPDATLKGSLWYVDLHRVVSV